MRFFFQFWRLEIATLQKYIILAKWMERSGNVDVVVESIHCLIDCNLKHAYKKTSRGWLGFTNWGGRPFICGGDTGQGGSLSELPKTACF